MFNPFAEKIIEHEKDIQLVRDALDGSRKALEALVFRHQAWIYNIALKMVLDHSDAEDVTQEILIKLVTKLSSYDSKKGAFRTWLYRIVVNHVINMKSRNYEKIFTSFTECADDIEKIADHSVGTLIESAILVEELKLKCWTAMLLCLNRRHRIVYILGEIFDVRESLGSEIVDVSKDNFRQMLCRARKKINNFMEQNCSNMNPDNPCRCSRNLKGFIENGFLNPECIQYYHEDVKKIRQVIYERQDEFDALKQADVQFLYQGHPFYESPDFKQWIQRTFSRDALKETVS